MRRRFFRRLGCFIALFVVFTVVVPATLLWHFVGGFGPRAGGFLGFAFVLLGLLVLLGLVPLARGVRGMAVPLGDLIEAAGRVEAGDYSARVPERPWGPPELQALPRAFNSMAERLEADERQRRTLLADISHELRTPLTVLQGELEAIVDGVHPADAAHLAATLDETRVLGRLIDDLRTLALAEAGTLALHREPTDLAILAREVRTSFATRAEAAKVELTTTIADELPLLDVDPVRIREVLANIVANALRYAPAGSTIAISAVLGGPGRVVASVSDSGPGIAPELLPHLFERFTKSAESRGSGLGLAIAKQLVEAHGGRIEAISAPGGGTTIRFELPVEAPAAR